MISEFTLDTSGQVSRWENRDLMMPGWRVWSDLSPLAQGYVERALRDLVAKLMESGDYLPALNGHGHSAGIGFSSLAPETLAAMLKDCERFLEAKTRKATPTASQYPHGVYGEGGDGVWGRMCWEGRQSGRLVSFPTLTLYIGDDGRVYQKVST